MDIKLFGVKDCKVCLMLEQNLFNALAELDIAAGIDKIYEKEEVLTYGITSLPSLVINGEVKISGRAPKKQEIKVWLIEEINK